MTSKKIENDLKKFATVKFIGNQAEYITGINCKEYLYCRQCNKFAFCKKGKSQLFINDKLYKAFFLDFCQGTRDALEVEAEDKSLITFLPLSDFEIISDEYDVLNKKQAIVKCITPNREDLQIGKEYVAIKAKNDYFYVLDDTRDCYYYPKSYFIVIEDTANILKSEP